MRSVVAFGVGLLFCRCASNQPELRSSTTYITPNFSLSELIGARDDQPCVLANNSLYCLGNGTFASLQTNVMDASCAASSCFTLKLEASRSGCTLWGHSNQSTAALWRHLNLSGSARVSATKAVVIVTDPASTEVLIYNLENGDVSKQALTLPNMTLGKTLYAATADGDTMVILLEDERQTFEVIVQRTNGTWRRQPTLFWLPRIFQPSPFLYLASSTMYFIPSAASAMFSDNIINHANVSSGPIYLTFELNFTHEQTAQLQSATIAQSQFLFLQYSTVPSCLEVRYNPLPHTYWKYIGTVCTDAQSMITGTVGDGHFLHVLTERLVSSIDTRLLPASLAPPPSCATSSFDHCTQVHKTPRSSSLSPTTLEGNLSKQATSSTTIAGSQPLLLAPSAGPVTSMSRHATTVLIIVATSMAAILVVVMLLVYRYHRRRSKGLV
jgi:hypothetical protein